MQFRTSLSILPKLLDSVILGSVVTLLHANATIRKKMRRGKPELYAEDDRLRHAPNELRTELTASIDRLQRIENKASSTVIGVSLAVTIIGIAPKIVGIDSPLAGFSTQVRSIASILLAGGLLFLLFSGYLALRAYAIGEIYRPTLHDMLPLISDQRAKQVLLNCIEQNHLIGTLRANYLSASFACLRNGIFLVALLGMVFVI